jgi:hypothetical protein
MLTRSERRVRTRARKFAYRIRRNADGSYMLTGSGDVPFFYDATLTQIDNFLRGRSAPQPVVEIKEG